MRRLPGRCGFDPRLLTHGVGGSSMAERPGLLSCWCNGLARRPTKPPVEVRVLGGTPSRCSSVDRAPPSEGGDRGCNSYQRGCRVREIAFGRPGRERERRVDRRRTLPVPTVGRFGALADEALLVEHRVGNAGDPVRSWALALWVTGSRKVLVRSEPGSRQAAHSSPCRRIRPAAS